MTDMVNPTVHDILRLGAFLCATLATLHAAEPRRGRPIEFSEPPSERGDTNLPTLMPRRSILLDQLESDINHPFKYIIPGNSLNGGIITDPRPLPAPPPPSAHSRDELNRRRDQMYLKPEDYALKPLEELYNVRELTPDGRDVRSLRPMEREIYRAFNSSSSPQATNLAPAIVGPGYGGFGKSEGSLFSGPSYYSPGFNASGAQDSALRRFLGADADSPAARARDARDARELFGLGEAYKPANRLTPAEIHHRDSFMQIYNDNYTPTVSGSPSSGGLFSPDSSFYDPPKPVALPSAPAMSVNPAASVSSVTPYTPSYVPPAPAPAPQPAQTPASPFMSLPRRNF